MGHSEITDTPKSKFKEDLLKMNVSEIWKKKLISDGFLLSFSVTL